MKRTVAIILAVLTLVTLFSATALAETKVIDTISVKSDSQLSKDTYEVGEKFNPKGLKFVVTYKDSTQDVISYNNSGLKFRTTPFTESEAAVGSAAIAYTYTKNGVTISNSDIDVLVYTLDHLDISQPPAKTEYYSGEAFNPNLMIVKAVYQIGGKDYKYDELTEKQFTWSYVDNKDQNNNCFTSGSSGKIKIIYKYNGTIKTCGYTVNGVYDNPPLELIIDKNPTKMRYKIGEKLDIKGGLFSVKYNNNTIKQITPTYDTSYTFTEEDAIQGFKKMKLTYKEGGDTVSTMLKVKLTFVKNLKITKPKKTSYTYGEALDTTGMVVTAVYSDGETEALKAGTYEISPSGKFAKEDFPGTKTITIAYTESGRTVTKTFDVDLVAATGIEIKTQPTKKEYDVGDVFDPSGMIVVVKYSNNAEVITNSYTYSTKPFEDANDPDDDSSVTPVTIHFSDGLKDWKKTIDVKVLATNAKTLYLSEGSLNLTAGEMKLLTATVYPKNADYDAIKWSSSKKAVADVDQNGLVYAIAPGTCIITGQVDDTGKRAHCYVTVTAKIGLTSLSFKQGSLELLKGDKTTLALVKAPTNATTADLTWKSSNESVVTVNADGQITGIAEGSAKITATSDGKTATLNVEVVSALSRWGTVYNCSSRVNVREKPSGSSKSMGYAPYGCRYKIVGEDSNWYQIVWGSKKVWIWKNYMKVGSSSEKTYEVDADSSTTTTTTTTTSASTLTTATKVTIVNCNRYVYIRKGPATTYSKIGHALVGATYTLKGASGDWYVIDYNGQTGYIFKSFGSVS